MQTQNTPQALTPTEHSAIVEVVDALLSMVEFAAHTRDCSCLWLCQDEFRFSTLEMSGRRIVELLHAAGLVDRRTLNGRTGRRAIWTCRLRLSVLQHAASGTALPWLDARRRKAIPADGILCDLYRRSGDRR